MAFVGSSLLEWILRGFWIIWFVAKGNQDGILWFRRWWITPLVEKVASI